MLGRAIAQTGYFPKTKKFVLVIQPTVYSGVDHQEGSATKGAAQLNLLIGIIVLK